MKFVCWFLHFCKILVVLFCLHSESILAADNIFRYLEDRKFRIDREETANLYKSLGVGIHRNLNIYHAEDDGYFNIEFYTIMYMVRDEHDNLFFAILQNQPLSLFNLWMQNLAESVGVRTIPSYPAFMNFNQQENMDILPKEILEKLRDAMEDSSSPDIPLYEPILIVHAPEFFVGRDSSDSAGYFEYFGEHLRGVFSPKKSPYFSPDVQKLLANNSFSKARVLDALSFLLLEYLLTVEGESRVNMDGNFVGVTINTFFKSLDFEDHRKILIKKLRSYLDVSVRESEMGSVEATYIYEKLLARLKFFKEVIPQSLAHNLRVFSGISIQNANYSQVLAMSRRIQKNVETRLKTAEEDIRFVFQQKMGRVFGGINFSEIERRATLSERTRNFTAEAEMYLSPNYEENVEKLHSAKRRGVEKRILWDLYRSPEINTPTNQRYWERNLGLAEYSLLETLMKESKKFDSTYRIRGILSAKDYEDVVRPVPQFVLPRNAPPSLLLLPMNDQEMEVIYKSAQEVAEYADLEILRLHNVPRPFEITPQIVHAIAQKYPGRRIILCEVKNAKASFVKETFGAVGSEVVLLDHHNQEFRNWDWRTTAEQFWDLYAYRPKAEFMLTAIQDRAGISGLARNVNIMDPESLRKLLTTITKTDVNANLSRLPKYKIEMDKSGLFYIVDDSSSKLRLRDIADHLSLKHFPDYFQLVIYRGNHLSYTGDPVVISHFVQRMYPLAKKHSRPMYWYGDLNQTLTVVYKFNSYDTVEKVMDVIRELNHERREGRLLLSDQSIYGDSNSCGPTFE